MVKSSAHGLTIWYARNGQYAGVLTYDHDDDIDAGTALIKSHAHFDLR